ncbi:MAG: hypothetical protein HKN25_17160 [Pyrinomonadaceae bacterium]|nr:hypothetical protein [Pyrinomonadaceae bacterium]
MIKKLNYKDFVVAVFAVSLLLGFGVEVNAQRKSKSKRTRKVASNANTVLEQRKKGAEDVAIQIKNISKFVFVLGGVASGIEQIDKDVRDGKASREMADKNAKYKADVIRSIRALRAGIVKLEIDFRTKPGLKPYSNSIQGIVNGSNRAEDSALAGNFRQAGNELLLVVETLADVLVEMP